MDYGRLSVRLFASFLSVSLLLLWGCTESSSSIESGAGYISLEATVNPTVTLASSGSRITLSDGVPDISSLYLRITDINGEYSSTWESIDEFDRKMPISPGSYLLETFCGELSSEGFGSPYFYGSTTVNVTSSTVTSATIDCHLFNAIINVNYDSSFTGRFPKAYVILHSDGGSYIDCPQSESRGAFVHPGDATVTVAIPDYRGDELRFRITKIKHVLAGYAYNLIVSASTDEDGTDLITISFDEESEADDITVALTEKFISSPTPEISVSGFSSGVALAINEGEQPTEPLTVTVDASGTPLNALQITTNVPDLIARGWPAELNLLTADDTQLGILSSLGLKWSDPAEMVTHGGTIDLTDVIPHLRIGNSTCDFSFTIRAVCVNSKVTAPAILKISMTPVDVSLLSVSPAVVGIDMVDLIIASSAASLNDNIEIRTRTSDGQWVNSRIVSLTPREDGTYTLRCEVPSGNSDIGLRLYYCGTLRGELPISRISPAYNVVCDAFARKAMLRIQSEYGAETDAAIISYLSVFDGENRLSIVDRDPSTATLTVTGLNPSTRYSLRATVMNNLNKPQTVVPVIFTTESAGELNNGDFEEIDNEIEYPGLPSGGRYSQSFVEIFNRQNKTDISLSAPENWANTNAKTFCRAARNHNTWYLEPSVYTVRNAYSGAYAVKLVSVAWDHDGEIIPDYVQKERPFTQYSGNVPTIARRSAGKLFLGSYSFDPQTSKETYSEGINFNSRPSSLNGVYAYQPGLAMLEDLGYARIEITGLINGRDEVIACGDVRLAPASGYTAFSIPLIYKQFGVKATKMRVFFASSCDIGDIATETQTIITTPDPATATSTGSQLWIDGLTLSY